MSDCKELDKLYLGNIGHGDELELVSEFPKHLPKVGSLRFRPDGGPYGVAFVEEDFDDVDGGETVRAGDEDFTSRGDDWHIFLSFECE